MLKNFTSFYKIAFLLLLAGWLTTYFQSCNVPLDKTTELEKIDSLTHWLDEAEKKMVIENKNVQQRYDSIEVKLNHISANIENISKEEQNHLTNYRAVRRTYNSYLQNYERIHDNQEKHRKRIQELREDVKAGSIDAEEFKKLYRDKRKTIRDHQREVEELVQPVLSVEPTYHRTQDKVRSMYQEALTQEPSDS